MILRRFTDFVLQSRVQAMATAFLSAFIPIIGSVSILIAALVTLRKGAIEGLYVLLAATLPYFISYFSLRPAPEQVQMAILMLGILIASNVLTWAFGVLLERFNNWIYVLELAAWLGVIVVGIVHFLYPEIQDWWATELNNYFSKTTAGVVESWQTATNLSSDAVNEAQIQAVNATKRYATGFAVVLILFNALVQLVVARWWQAVMFNPGGLQKELHQIRLSHVTAGLFLIGLILAYFGNAFATDAMPVLFAIFFVAGLSLVHYLLGLTKKGWIGLIVIYLAIIWLFPLSIMIVAILALFDTGLDIRKRIKL